MNFQGSIGIGLNNDSSPNFAASQSVTNMWSFIEVIDLENGAPIRGNTGIALVAVDNYRIFGININGLLWLNARVTARTAGNVTVKVLLFND